MGADFLLLRVRVDCYDETLVRRLIMRFLALALAVVLCASATAQTAVLRIDSSTDNHCAQAKQGGMWVLELPYAQTIGRQKLAATVYLQRTDPTSAQQHTVVYTIRSGETTDLGCTAGNPAIYYSIIKQDLLQ